MELKKATDCDVLVLGSGIAGISAALRAAELGARVILACKGPLFSGSSFYPGTWGLGLIGPENEADKKDLAETILRVGQGMADPKLVETFVGGIAPAIENLRKKGVRLRRANQAGQKEFIPCFDHKHRDWNGIEFDSVREVLGRELEQKQVRLFPGWEALHLVKDQGAVCGAVLSKEEQLCYVAAGAVVLATGGYGSLFQYHLCTEDVAGMGQYLALEAGCRLVNMEFMQMMPGYLTPAFRTIFNEKTFRFTKMTTPDGKPLLTPEAAAALPERSGYGPFTCRLAGKAVDLAIFRAFRQDDRGVTVSYTQELKDDPPEFISVYFDWLKEAKGLTVDDPVHIGIFAHAANGGVAIDGNAWTGVPGLYAAGEVTGGMHGADRIGGLSTANGLVFGGIAGASAVTEHHCAPETISFPLMTAPGIAERKRQLQQLMFQNAMVIRSGEGLAQALAQVQQMREALLADTVPAAPQQAAEAADTLRLLAQYTTAQSLLLAASLRTESRGSHYREDYPAPSKALEHPTFLEMRDGKICPCR